MVDSVDSSSDIELFGLVQNIHRYEEIHDQVLEETKKVCDAFIISSSIGFFGESMMLTIWILFAFTLNDCTDESVTILVFLVSILQIVGVLISSYLSDIYGFDIIAILTSTILLISILLHSLSFSIITLGIGISLKGLVMDDIEVLSLGFIAKLLPHNTAAIYTGYWYTYTTIPYLLGLICGGILSTYTALSYRMVFIVCLFIIIFRWIYILVKLRNTQNKLIQKQLPFIKYYLLQKEKDNNSNALNTIELTEIEKTWFPLCLEEIRDKNKNEEINHNTVADYYIWIELTLNMFQFGFISCFINVTFQFIGLYMLNRYNLSVFWTTTQIITSGITFSILPLYLPNYIQSFSLTQKYLLSIPFYAIMIVIFMFAIPRTEYKNIYLLWIWWFITGIAMGALFVISEICILELQPKRHSGKINGIKTAIRFATAAVLATLIAYFWNSGEQYIWFCYFQGIVYIIALFVNSCLIFMTMWCINNRLRY